MGISLGILQFQDFDTFGTPYKNTSLLYLVQMKSTFLRDNEMQNSEYLCNFAPPHLFHILGPFYIDGGVYVTTHDVIVDLGL